MSDGIRDGFYDVEPHGTEGGSNEGMVEIVELAPDSIVLRSPETGRLYGIAFDQTAGGEEVTVTELEEPKATQ
jgi:hypothetical protein